MTEPNIYVDPKQQDTDISKCSSCGSNMVFDPNTQGLLCPYCGNRKEIVAGNTHEIEFVENKKYASWGDETHVYRCSNCGATEVLEKHQISIKCPFCGTGQVVLEESLSGQKPNGVVPFKLTKEAASGSVTKWAKKKVLAPKRFKESMNPENINGVYSPAFTFDADTDTRYIGRLGKYYTTTRTVNGKTVTERRVRYFDIRGDYGCIYDEVMVQASQSFSQETLSNLRPFDSNNSKEYKIDFLFGYQANAYSKDSNQCFKEADMIIKEKIKRGILSQYTYDVVDSLQLDVTYNNVLHKYLLLPIYVGNFNYNKKLYNFFVNGFTGKVTGKTPISALKILLIVGIIVAIIGAVAGIYLAVRG